MQLMKLQARKIYRRSLKISVVPVKDSLLKMVLGAQVSPVRKTGEVSREQVRNFSVLIVELMHIS